MIGILISNLSVHNGLPCSSIFFKAVKNRRFVLILHVRLVIMMMMMMISFFYLVLKYVRNVM